MKETIITKAYINDNIRPFTPNDTLFNATAFEAVMEDAKPTLGTDICAELLNEDATTPLSDELEQALEKGLRKGLAYLIFARCVRTAQSVVTKYGYVQKDAQEYSTRPYNDAIVADANYFKKLGMDIIKDFAYLNQENKMSPVVDSDNSYNCRVIGY